jgi:hypothetical protein
MRILGGHFERADDVLHRGRDPSRQVFVRVIVHQEADRPTVHAINRPAAVHLLVQRLQHEAVAAQRHDDVGLLWTRVAIERREMDSGGLGVRRR